MSMEREPEDLVTQIAARVGMLLFAFLLVLAGVSLFLVALLGMIAGIRAGH